MYRHDKPNKKAKEGPLSFVLLEFSFTSVSAVVSLVFILRNRTFWTLEKK
jgi:hypothetical protein